MVPRAREKPAGSARASAPAHVTLVFAPRTRATDPRARGSIGAGLVLEREAVATVRWWPARRPSLEVRANTEGRWPITRWAVRQLVGRRAIRLELALSHGLPVGQGFGMSAAGALAASLATGQAVRRSDDEAFDAAHRADLWGGGGLGGVAAIAGGGWEIRTRPGLPPEGEVAHRPLARRVFVAVLGLPMPSPRLLRNPRFLARVERACGDALHHLGSDPRPEVLFEEGERFTDRLSLGPPSLTRSIRALRATGSWVAQAMLGRSLVAIPRDRAARARLVRALERRRVPAVELGLATEGARRRR